jgi:mannitol-1-/sugar-/sorbitol-6-phosphatase
LAVVIRVQCEALLFDLDGVLIDSTPAVTRVWSKWARARGFNPEEVVAHAHGRPSIATVREYLPGADHDAENRIVERSEIEDLDGVVPLPGARELLESLPANRWTIVTSGTRALAEVRLRAAGLPAPKEFVTATDVVNGKPHPEPFLKAAKILAVAASDCVVVEDAPAGIRAGKAATARVIAFPTTSEQKLLVDAGADWIVKDCSGIAVAEGERGLHLRLAQEPV